MFYFFEVDRKTGEEDDDWFLMPYRFLFKKAKQNVRGGFRHHETMRHGASLRRVDHHVVKTGTRDRFNDFLLRRNYKKFWSSSGNHNTRGVARQPSRRRVSRTGGPRTPPGGSQYLVPTANKGKFQPAGPQMSHGRAEGRRFIVDDDLAASATMRQDSGRSQRSQRSPHDDDYNDALLDSAKIKLENFIETFNEKLSNMTLDCSM